MRIAAIFTSGNTSDNVIGLEVLKLVKQPGFRQKYVLADSGYDDIKIYEFMISVLLRISISSSNSSTAFLNLRANSWITLTSIFITG